MRSWIAILSLAWLVAASCAHADEIKDVDKWAADFMAVATKADANAMTDLVRPYTTISIDKIDALNKNIQSFLSPSRELYAEQFAPAQLGSFARRINVAVIYNDRQMFYSVFFLRREDGWQIYYYAAFNTLGEVVKITWP